MHLISGSPAVAVRMVKMLAGAVKEKEENLLQMAYDSVRRRVAKALVKLAEDDFNAEVHLSREELANIVGIAKETLIRTLSDLKSENLIEVKGNTIRVLQAGQLLRI